MTGVRESRSRPHVPGGPGGPTSGPDRRHDPGPSAADDVRRARAGVRHAEVTYRSRPGSRRPPRRHTTFAEHVGIFTRRWGWRGYAVPLLVVVTAVLLASIASSHGGDQRVRTASGAGSDASGGGSHGGGRVAPAPATAPPQIQLKSDTAGSDAVNSVPRGYSLPAGPAYTLHGAGTFRMLAGTSPVAGKTGRLYRYSIEVERGVQGIDLTQFQDEVVSTLSDPRSWSGHGVRLQRVDSGPIDFHVSLTSAFTVRKYCGYTIHVETSCYAPRGSDGSEVNRVVFDDARWVRGSTAYLGDLLEYRRYMINHEDGHALGHEHAHQCLADGYAPAMMQQTFGLRSAVTGKLCQANPWPYPPGATDAPGQEQPDTPQNDEYGLGD